MSKYSLSHLSDGALLRDLAAIVTRDRATTAELLAHLAEVDARKLYRPMAYPEMLGYCVGELRMSEDVACRRIRAARAAQLFPAIFDYLADGRLHLSAVVMLARHLTEENASDLLAAAEHRSKSEIKQLLAERSPQRDLPTRIDALPADSHAASSAPARMEEPGAFELSAPARMDPPTSRISPLSPQRFGLQVTISQNTHDKLRYAQELLSHRLRPGDLAEVLDLALDALIERLEKGRFGARSGRRRGRGLKTDSRYIPLAVKHAVWKRDGGQCTFVSESGQRCPSREKIQFDHIEEFANGGLATVSNLRLLCHAHNQYAAELKFGAEFMKQKCESARRATAKRAERAAEPDIERAAVFNGAPPAAPAPIEGTHTAVAVADQAEDRDVIPWLRALGIRADDARRASKVCDNIPDAPLEQRVKLALGSLARSRPRPAWRPASAA